MKSPRLVAVAALCATLLLSACSVPDTAVDSPPTVSPPSSSDAALETLRAQYEAELSTLRRELDALRAEDTARRADYETRIEALEAAIRHLQNEVPKPVETQKIPDFTATTTAPPPRETAAPPCPDAGDSPAETIFHYRMELDGAVICTYLGTEAVVVIPAEIGGYPVTRIADNAFAGTGVTEVTIPPTVTHIGWFAFYGCTALRSVTLPPSVVSIDYGAFEVCPVLTLQVQTETYAEAYAMAFGYAYRVTE